MDPRLDRRTFLAGAGGLLVASGVGCDAGGGRVGSSVGSTGGEGRAAPGERLQSVSRPILRPWADDIVWLDAAPGELPVAYVSMERMQVFVDHDFRDRASWLLRAHISVSTALWRIPLRGDPPREPITPGDEAREFEERPIREWDSIPAPALDDVRIVRGRAALRSVDFSCVPVSGRADRWCSAGPFDLAVADPSVEGTVREDFAIAGAGRSYRARTCEGDADAIQLLSWTARADV